MTANSCGPGTGAGVERRRLLGVSLSYFWMGREAFERCEDPICLLKTHEELPEEAYHLKFTCRTFLIDLKQSTEELFAALEYKGARYPVNKAIRSGVTVRHAESPDEKERFYRFYRTFFREPGRENKMLVLQETELGRLEVFHALSPEGEYLGGVALLPSPDRRYLLYKYAATSRRFCENDLLVWHAIGYAKAAGYAYFDMSAFQPTDDTESDQYRLYQFKKKFGGKMVDFHTYARFKGIWKLPGMAFRMFLKRFFRDDLNRFALFLKKVKAFT